MACTDERVRFLTGSIVGVEVVTDTFATSWPRAIAMALAMPRPEPVTRALRPTSLFLASMDLEASSMILAACCPALTNTPYNAASASTMALALTTVPCRGNTFSISSVWTSGSRSAHPSSTTIRW